MTHTAINAPLHPASEKLQGINLTGNVVPIQWYPIITRESGKPDSVAVPILADIIYWYRPVEVRDEQTGQIIGYRQKFKADKLQKSYQEYADLLGFGKRQVKNAFDTLESLGLVHREFRNIETPSGHKLFNVMFVEPDMDRVFEITRLKCPINSNMTKKGDTDPPKKGTQSPQKKGHNTKSTTEIKKTTTTTDVVVVASSSGTSDGMNPSDHPEGRIQPVPDRASEPNKETSSKDHHHPETTIQPPPDNASDDIQDILQMIPVRVTPSITLLIIEAADEYGPDYVRQNVLYTNDNIKDKRKYRYYLENALKKGWGDGYGVDEPEPKQKPEPPKIELSPGMKLKWPDGNVYTLDRAGYLFIGGVCVPEGTIRQMILNGNAACI